MRWCTPCTMHVYNDQCHPVSTLGFRWSLEYACPRLVVSSPAKSPAKSRPLHLHLRTSVQSTASCLLQLEPWRTFLLLAASSAGDSSRNPQMTFPSFHTNHQYLPPSSSSNLANMRPTSSSLTNFRYPCSTSASSDFLAHLAAFLRSLMT